MQKGEAGRSAARAVCRVLWRVCTARRMIRQLLLHTRVASRIPALAESYPIGHCRFSSSKFRMPYTTEANSRIQVSGTIERIVYRSPDSMFSILAVNDMYKSQRHTVVAKSALLGDTQVGHQLNVEGKLVVHKKFGPQVEVTNEDVVQQLSGDAETRHSLQENDAASVLTYLKLGMIQQVGAKTAKTIVNHFGDETAHAMLDPVRLQEVSGIGKKKASVISNSWRLDSDQGNRPTIMYLLSEYGMTFYQAKMLLLRYGVAAPDIVKRNPYRLIDDIQGIAFARADHIARSMGIPVESPMRLKAALLHCLSVAGSASGHTCLSKALLCENAADLLSIPEEYEPDIEYLEAQIESLATENRVHILNVLAEDDDHIKEELIFSKSMHSAEDILAQQLKKLLDHSEQDQGKPEHETSRDGEMTRSSVDGSMILNDDQAHAVHMAKSNRLVILTGGPGTGKTATTRCVIEQWIQMGIQPNEIILTSPTARAARHLGRVANSIGQDHRSVIGNPFARQGSTPQKDSIESKTVHKLLQYDRKQNGFRRGPERPLEYRAVVLDEASMLDTVLASALLSSLKPDTRLLIVGDADQLPSVGAGTVLRDLVSSSMFLDRKNASSEPNSLDAQKNNNYSRPESKIPVVQLKHIYRQDEASDIIKAAHKFNQGITPPPSIMRQVTAADLKAVVDQTRQGGIGSPLGDCLWVDESNPQIGTELISGLIMEYVSKSGFVPHEDVQVLAPMHKGKCGVETLNQKLKVKFNPNATEPYDALDVGDRCMMEKNDYDLNCFNGETGKVVMTRKFKGLSVDMGSGSLVDFNMNQAKKLSLSYACTVHKSQGQEFPVIIMPCYMEHAHLLERSICYTALTRAQHLVIFVGQRGALGYALRRTLAHNRITGLVTRLTGANMDSEELANFSANYRGDNFRKDRGSKSKHMRGGDGLVDMWEDLGVENFMPSSFTA